MHLRSPVKQRHQRQRGSLRLLTLALVLFAPAAAAETLRVGVYQNPPKIYQNAAGTAEGFFPQVLNAIAADEGWQLHYQPCEWQQCLQQLQQTLERFDLAAAHTTLQDWPTRRDAALSKAPGKATPA